MPVVGFKVLKLRVPHGRNEKLDVKIATRIHHLFLFYTKHGMPMKMKNEHCAASICMPLAGNKILLGNTPVSGILFMRKVF